MFYLTHVNNNLFSGKILNFRIIYGKIKMSTLATTELISTATKLNCNMIKNEIEQR